MANWYGSARSNYVQVDDKEGLKKALEPFFHEIQMDDRGEKGVCFVVAMGSEYGGWPSTVFSEVQSSDEEGNEFEDEVEYQFNPAEQICPYLQEGQILIMQEVGAEKLRYLTGWAEAYQAKTGEAVMVSIDDIYKKAAEKFGVDVNSISLAQY